MPGAALSWLGLGPLRLGPDATALATVIVVIALAYVVVAIIRRLSFARRQLPPSPV